MKDDELPKPIPKIKKNKTYREKMLEGSLPKKKKSGRMRARTPKRAKQEKEYSKVAREYLNETPYCEVCENSENPSIHHKAGREGSLLTNKDYFMHACLSSNYLDHIYPESNHNHTGGCHGWIEANKDLAQELGYIIRL